MSSWLALVKLPPWLALLCETILLCLCAAYTLGLLRAMAPKRGTLEWIAMYDRPEVQFDLPGGRFRPIELLPCAVTGLAAGLIYILAVCLQLGTFSIFATSYGLSILMGGGLMFAIGGAICFAFTRSLYGSWPLASALALLVGLDFFADYNQVLSLLVLQLFLHRWMRESPDAPASRSFLWLFGAEAAAAISVAMKPAMIFPVACFGLLAVFMLALRFHLTHRIDRAKQLGLTVLFFVPAFYVLLLLCRGAVEVGMTGSFDFLANPGFYLRAITRWVKTANLITPARSLAGIHLPLLVLGILGAAVSVYGCFRYGHFEGLLLPAALLGAVLMWAFTGVAALSAAAVPACGYFFAHYLRRGYKALAFTGLGVCFAVTVLYDVALILSAMH